MGPNGRNTNIDRYSCLELMSSLLDAWSIRIGCFMTVRTMLSLKLLIS